MNITEVYKILSERYKDEPILKIYWGYEANKLMREKFKEDNMMDEEDEQTCLFACTNFDLWDKPGPYLDGSYFIYFDPPPKQDRLVAVWVPHPVDYVPEGLEAIIKELDEWKIKGLTND